MARDVSAQLHHVNLEGDYNNKYVYIYPSHRLSHGVVVAT